MQVLRVVGAGAHYTHKWPGGPEDYEHWIEYQTIDEDGDHTARIAFGSREAYGQERARVLVLIDGYPYAEFLGADDFERTGTVLSQVRVPGRGGGMWRYPDDPIPARYVHFAPVGLHTRVTGHRVQQAWAVPANVSDHRTMIALAGLRISER